MGNQSQNGDGCIETFHELRMVTTFKWLGSVDTLVFLLREFTVQREGDILCKI